MLASKYTKANLKKVLQSRYLQDTFVLMSANGFAQVILFVSLPFLSRIYLPEDFALFEVFFVVVGPLVLAIDGRYNLALMLPRDAKKASHLLFGSLGIVIIIGAVLIGLVLIFGDWIISLAPNNTLLTSTLKVYRRL